MVTISLCMIVKNEENTLSKCLASVSDIADEIIIVDTGSIDKTKDIAFKYTNKVYDFEWIDDFAAARNYSFSKASMDFILWMDADDIFLEEDRKLFKLLKSDLTLQIDTVMMKYVVERDENGKTSNFFYRERLLRREKNFKWNDCIHEYINFFGSVILHTEIAVTHTKIGKSTERNLRILKKVIFSELDIQPRHLFYYARELQDSGNLEEAEIYYSKFLGTKNDTFSHYIEGSIQLSNLYMQKNERNKALKILIRSFEYGPMRGEILFMIGHYYLESKDYFTAISWYELILSLRKPKFTWDFILPEYWDFLPYLELCHCYYMIGDLSKSLEYHNKAKLLKPYDYGVIQNEEFFNNVLKETNSSNFEKMIDTREYSNSNYFYYGKQLYDNERYDDAMVHFEKILLQNEGYIYDYIYACIYLSKIYSIKNDRNNAIKILLEGFQYRMPRPELCCELGIQYEDLKDYKRAILWYEIATKINKPENIVVVEKDYYYNYIPYAAMSICYYKLGFIEKAIEYNEKASQFNPHSQLVNNNREYYKTFLNVNHK